MQSAALTRAMDAVTRAQDDLADVFRELKRLAVEGGDAAAAEHRIRAAQAEGAVALIALEKFGAGG